MAKPVKKSAPAKAAPSLKMVSFDLSSVKDVIAATGAKKTGKLLHVPVGMISMMPGFNLRIDTPAYRAGIETLKRDIMQEGFYETKPLSAVAAKINGEDRVVITDGHRRFEAAMAAIADGADIETLPVILRDGDVTDVDLAVALDKENRGVRPSMLENAVLAKRLMSTGMDEMAVAERLNVVPRYINDLKLLINAPKDIRDLVKEEKISGTEVVARFRKDPEGAAEKIRGLAEKAETRAAEKGADRSSKLTRSAIENNGVKPPKMAVHRSNFSVTEGSPFLWEDAEPFAASITAVVGDESWFKPARKKAERIATVTLDIEVKLRLPKTDDEPGPTEPAEPAKPAKGKGGKAGSAPAADPDLLDSAFDDDEPTDLKAAGIAEPADDGL